MYEPLYRLVDEFTTGGDVDVEVGFRGDHPALNAHLASLADPPYDLVSTHTKYAPSQSHFLAPLQTLIPADELADFYPRVLELAVVDGDLLGLPRNIDVRMLHYRTDLIDEPPQDWDALFELARKLTKPKEFYGFAFPGRESGLFGTFFELCEAAGAHLFPENHIPDIANDGGRWALGLLRQMYTAGVVPPEIVDWHYDEVHRSFREGYVAMIGDWPAYYRAHLDPAQSQVHDRFSGTPYPTGPSGESKAYGGSHTFALTHRGASNPDAIDLLRFLTAPKRQVFECSSGSVPVRQSVMRQVLETASEKEFERWRMLESVIATSVIIPPKMKRYPEIEAVLWHTLQKAITGRIGESEALDSIVSQIAEIVNEHQGASTPFR
jgi:multiple sugar transport system substrate-binding protein